MINFDLRRLNARILFCNCDLSAWHATTIPVGICVTLTAESVVFTCCPPAPEDL